MLRAGLVAWVLVGTVVAAGACRRGGSYRILDLGPRSGWLPQRVLAVDSTGRLSLLADGSGSAVKRVTLDVTRFPILLVRTAQTLPRLTWTIAIAPPPSPTTGSPEPIPLISRHAEEGQYVVPLAAATGWHGTVSFDLVVRLDGHARDWIELADLEAVAVADRPPPRPRPELPADGALVSAPALHYEWFQARDALSYDLEVARSPGFAGATATHVPAPYLADKLPYLPRDGELLPPGHWYWRVRGRSLAGRPGPWSRTSRFDVAPLPPDPRSPSLRISAEHPLVVLMANASRLGGAWASVPDSLKAFTVLRVEALPSESLEAAASRAERLGIPIVVQLSGPHDYYGPVSSRIPLTEVERLFRAYPAVRGAYICEQAFRVAPPEHRVMLDYARRLVTLAAAYGRVVLWADGHWGHNLWIDVGLDRALMDTLRAHPATLVPIWKMNGALTPFTAQGAVFGLWVSGAVRNWGVQPEGWYWYEAGLGDGGRRPGVSRWFKEGDRAQFPPGFYGQMALLGVSGGATVYSFEPPTDLWAEGGGEPKPTARDVIFPVLTAITRRGLVPPRRAVLDAIRAVYLADSADLPWSLDYGRMRPLYAGSYGISFPFAMIPETGRYFWIPILPRWRPDAAGGRRPLRLRGADLGDSASVRRRLDALYPPQRGEAWVAQVGGLTVVMSAGETGVGSERFDLSLRGLERLTGSVDRGGYLAALGGMVVLRHDVAASGVSR